MEVTENNLKLPDRKNKQTNKAGNTQSVRSKGGTRFLNCNARTDTCLPSSTRK